MCVVIFFKHSEQIIVQQHLKKLFLLWEAPPPCILRVVLQCTEANESTSFQSLRGKKKSWEHYHN